MWRKWRIADRGFPRVDHTDGLMKPSGPNLLDEPLKGFIVNPVGLPRKGVNRLATSGERVNHDSQ